MENLRGLVFIGDFIMNKGDEPRYNFERYVLHEAF